MGTVSPELVQSRLEEEGFASIDFGLSPQDFDDLFGLFRSVIDESESPGGDRITRALTFQLAGREEDGDYYLVKRVPGDNHPLHPNRAVGTEHKYTAHIGPLSLAYAVRQLGRSLPANLGKLWQLQQRFTIWQKRLHGQSTKNSVSVTLC